MRLDTFRLLAEVGQSTWRHLRGLSRPKMVAQCRERLSSGLLIQQLESEQKSTWRHLRGLRRSKMVAQCSGLRRKRLSTSRHPAVVDLSTWRHLRGLMRLKMGAQCSAWMMNKVVRQQ